MLRESAGALQDVVRTKIGGRLGFTGIRHYGWLAGAARKTRLLVRALVCGQIGERISPPHGSPDRRRTHRTRSEPPRRSLRPHQGSA